MIFELSPCAWSCILVFCATSFCGAVFWVGKDVSFLLAVCLAAQAAAAAAATSRQPASSATVSSQVGSVLLRFSVSFRFFDLFCICLW